MKCTYINRVIVNFGTTIYTTIAVPTWATDMQFFLRSSHASNFLASIKIREYTKYFLNELFSPILLNIATPAVVNSFERDTEITRNHSRINVSTAKAVLLILEGHASEDLTCDIVVNFGSSGGVQ